MMTNSVATNAHLYAHSQGQNDPAALLFGTALLAGRRRRFWAGLRRTPTALRGLRQTGTGVQGGHSAGRQQVRLADIRGTEGRASDFDDQFYPLSELTRKRWVSVARAMEAGLALPPVQLIRVGGEYFVRDGHHRVSVARALGQETIDADVTVWAAG